MPSVASRTGEPGLGIPRYALLKFSSVRLSPRTSDIHIYREDSVVLKEQLADDSDRTREIYESDADSANKCKIIIIMARLFDSTVKSRSSGTKVARREADKFHLRSSIYGQIDSLLYLFPIAINSRDPSERGVYFAYMPIDLPSLCGAAFNIAKERNRLTGRCQVGRRKALEKSARAFSNTRMYVRYQCERLSRRFNFPDRSLFPFFFPPFLPFLFFFFILNRDGAYVYSNCGALRENIPSDSPERHAARLTMRPTAG